MSDTTTPSYRTTLAVPKAKQVLALGVLSRLPSGLIPFSVLISFTQHHGIGIAGLASAALLLAIALPGPARARWTTSRGPAALLLMALLSVGLFAAAAATTALDTWQIPLLLVAAAGSVFPPLTPSLRAAWSRLMPDKHHLQRIHALDSTIEELTFVAAPLLGTAVMALTDARWALVGSAALLLPAALGLTVILRTLPPADGSSAATPGSETSTRRRSIIRTSEGQGITVPVIALGLCGGGLTVIIPAASANYADVISSGYSFAAFSLGGVVGGLAYGRKNWNSTLRTRYTAATAGLVLGALLLAALSTSPLTILAVFCIGLPMTPIFVLAYLLVDERIDSSRHTEANAWLGSGYNLGSAAGSALGGQLLALTGPRLLAVALAGVAAAIAHRLPEQPSPEPSSDTPEAARQADMPLEPGTLSKE
ncbi:MFS transporter [Streptomyces lateritius]|uniref:MFS transporter n=1 Tax=Streptomyces lateritius TaxID=67313 RepID=UPI001C8BFE7B|nr:MFS transporter [Streptomyces lateritius]MBX9420841.1 MFS transporter [Streptomyces lateritius]